MLQICANTGAFICSYYEFDSMFSKVVTFHKLVLCDIWKNQDVCNLIIFSFKFGDFLSIGLYKMEMILNED